ncbi:(2Fe-2S)-binding protein [Virgibacillus ndiopensis]|uniref:(2Fe-2S)-binding protein n=1 Tax=Virgibacillus ndiopensis TaxID=2004408 RepID=UPI000C07AB58|nr:(2Fe-2S)-binding protein [Virgibacillus ndiopensis]
MDASTIVCKCEEINIAEIELAIKSGANTFDDIKRLTRCGMGPCQAKICTNLVRQIISESLEVPLSEIRPPRLRMPLKPTRISALVGNEVSSSVISVFSESAPQEDDENHG